jgi:hypothetical protein
LVKSGIDAVKIKSVLIGDELSESTVSQLGVTLLYICKITGLKLGGIFVCPSHSNIQSVDAPAKSLNSNIAYWLVADWSIYTSFLVSTSK